ncbi:MAG TPA: hypothetical protein VHP37_32280 [Burkholderiales bacterium]|nr:hypothetical protein [Burkholderiales bacterium]
MTIEDKDAAAALLRRGVIVPVQIVEEQVIPGADEGEFALRLALSFEDDDSPEEDRADIVEWGALGFMFVIAVLSFADARPRGVSELEYNAADDFNVSDLVGALKYRCGELHLDADYVRGRRMKTRVVIRADGTGVLETVGRGKAALRWIARLKGEKPLRAAD